MSKQPQQDAAGTADQRHHDRNTKTGLVSMESLSQVLIGQVSNASSGGVMFLSGESLRITVQLEQDGKLVERTGRLVRVARVNKNETAFAVEFDE